MRKQDNDYIDLKNMKDRDRVFSKFNKEQKEMFKSIQDNIFTFVEAKSGTGKTLVSISAMIDLLANEEINKIVYFQKVSDRYLEHGFLAGSLEEKTNMLWTPFYDAMTTLGFFESTIQHLLNKEIIILTTDSVLRGVNLEKCGIIADECENCDTETLRLIFTRCHDDCHVVMIGDSRQKDNAHKDNREFIYYGEYLSNQEFGNKCKLTKNYRGKFSKCAEDFIYNFRE